MKKALNLLLVLCLCGSMAACGNQKNDVETETAKYTVGEYTGKAVGMDGDVNVIVTFSENAIEKIEIGEENETTGICEVVYATLPSAIVKYQSLDVDLVAGATFTSRAVINAVEDAVKQAGGDAEALKAVKVEKEVIDEAYDYDIVVVGGGLAGITAAIKAKAEGANVALVEKLGMLGGTSVLSAGYVNTISDNDEETVNQFAAAWTGAMKDYDVNAEMVNLERFKATVSAAPKVLEYLQTAVPEAQVMDFGQKFFFAAPTEQAIKNAEHLPATTGGSAKAASSLIFSLADYLDEIGVDVYTTMPATSLIHTENQVNGVICQTENGTKTFNAKAVILATGDYMNNKDLCKEYNLYSYYNYSATSCGADGTGIEMALEAGAVLYDNQYYMGGAYVYDPYNMQLAGFASNDTPTSALYLSLEGDRRCSEAMDAHGMSFYYDSNEHENAVWTIMTEEVANTIPTLESLLEKTENGSTLVKMAKLDTIEELSDFTGIELETLSKAIDDYNALCDAGTDSQYGKDASLLIKLEAPYYVGKAYSISRGTIGGIKTLVGGEVINSENEIISGLYAAGAVSNGEFYTTYYPGGQLGISADCGYLAAQSALEYINQ